MTDRSSMLGIVLWVGADGLTAVLWCEDQGDLAYLRCCNRPEADNPCCVANADLDAGDLVHFDLAVEGNLRVAHNVRILAGDHNPQLVSRLKEAGGISAPVPQAASQTVERSRACDNARDRWKMPDGTAVLF